MILRVDFISLRRGIRWSCILFLLAASIQLTGATALAQAVDAHVASVKGTALRRNNQRAYILARGDSLNPGDEVDTRGGGRVVIELTDGSVVVVHPNSRIIISNYRAAASLREMLRIIIGRVRVKVAHYGGKPNPYRVNSPTASILVRGTEFSVAVEPSGDTRVEVYDGLVEVQSLSDPSRRVYLSAKQGALVKANEDIRLFTPGSGDRNDERGGKNDDADGGKNDDADGDNGGRNNDANGDSADSNANAGLNAITNANTGLNAKTNEKAGLKAKTNENDGANADTNENDGADADTNENDSANTETKANNGVKTKTNANAGLNATTNANAGLNATTNAIAGIKIKTKGNAGVISTTSANAAPNANAAASAKANANANANAGLNNKANGNGGASANPNGNAGLNNKANGNAGLNAKTNGNADLNAKTNGNAAPNGNAGLNAKTNGNAGLNAKTNGNAGLNANPNGNAGVSAKANANAAPNGNAGLNVKTNGNADLNAKANANAGLNAKTNGNAGASANPNGNAGLNNKANANGGVSATTNANGGVSANPNANAGLNNKANDNAGLNNKANANNKANDNAGARANPNANAGLNNKTNANAGDIASTNANIGDIATTNANAAPNANAGASANPSDNAGLNANPNANANRNDVGGVAGEDGISAARHTGDNNPTRDDVAANATTSVRTYLTNGYDRYVDGLAGRGWAIPLQRFSAFADSHFDSLDNPAYSTEFASIEGRAWLIPYFNKSRGGDLRSGSAGFPISSNLISPFDSGLLSQVDFYIPLEKVRMVIGGAVAVSSDRSESLSADQAPASLIRLLPGGGQVSRYVAVSTETTSITGSLTVARRFGDDGRTSVGAGVEWVSDDGGLRGRISLANGARARAIEELEADSEISRLRFRLGMTRKFDGGHKLGLVYSHELATAADRDRSRLFAGPLLGIDSTRQEGRSSEVSFRLRGPLTRRLFYGVEGSLLWGESEGQIRRAVVTDSNMRADVNSAAAGFGVGFALRRATVLSADFSFGLSGVREERLEEATGNSVEDRRERGRFVSGRVGLQTDVWRQLFASASTLVIGQTFTTDLDLRPDILGRRLTSLGLIELSGRSRRNSTNVFSDFGAGWRINRYLLAEYIFSINNGLGPTRHVFLLRYTFKREE